jgi:hypothetical protein
MSLQQLMVCCNFCRRCAQSYASSYGLLLQLGELPTERACTEQTAKQWLQERCKGGAEQRTAGFADAYYANDIGTELALMGMAEAAWEARNWSDGESTLVKGASFAAMVSHLARGVPVRLSWPVSTIIQHSGCSGDGFDRLKGGRHEGVTVIGPGGEVRAPRASLVLLAISLSEERVLLVLWASQLRFRQLDKCAKRYVHKRVFVCRDFMQRL